MVIAILENSSGEVEQLGLLRRLHSLDSAIEQGNMPYISHYLTPAIGQGPFNHRRASQLRSSLITPNYGTSHRPTLLPSSRSAVNLPFIDFLNHTNLAKPNRFGDESAAGIVLIAETWLSKKLLSTARVALRQGRRELHCLELHIILLGGSARFDHAHVYVYLMPVK